MTNFNSTGKESVAPVAIENKLKILNNLKQIGGVKIGKLANAFKIKVDDS